MQKNLREDARRSRKAVSILLLSVIQWIALQNAFAISISAMEITQKRITISIQNALLTEALDAVGQRGGFGITYNNEDIPVKRITQRFDNVSVGEVLDQMLRDTGLMYKEYKGNLVIIRIPEKEKKTSTKGSIQGVLSDAESGEALVGASIRVIGTSMGASTDVDGKYSIPNVPEGLYQLAVSYIGYDAAVIREVKVVADQTTTINHKLAPAKTQLQDIVVIGDKALSGNVVETNEVSLVNEIKGSNLIITGVSAQQIARSVDQDAGEVARRLPGVSLLNNFVNIRGMHERYNLTYLNGMIAPSSEADKRAFSYDLLPSNMIDKMTVYRSPGPELLGDWAGGVIKIDTKNTAIARQFEANISTWYRPESTFENYYTYEGGGKDWLGKDDGTRALPKNFPGIYAIPGGTPQQVNDGPRERNNSEISSEDLAQNAAWGRSLYNKWNLQKAQAPLDIRAGLNYYDSWRIGNMRLSNLTSINTTQASQIIFQDLTPDKAVGNDGIQNVGRSYKDTISRKTARWGLLQNLKLQINPRHALEASGVFNQLGIDETYVRDGYNAIIGDFDLGYSRKIFYTYRSRSILATQLAGTHELGKEEGTNKITWTAGYSRSSEDIPGQRLMYLQSDTATENAAAKRYLTSGIRAGAFSLANSLYYADSDEDNFTFTANYEKKFSSGTFLRAGFFNESKNRDINSRLIAIGPQHNKLFITTQEGGLVDEHNAEEGLGRDNFKEDGTNLFIFDNEYLSGRYSVKGNIVAGYAAVNVPLFNKKLNIYGGVRYEGQNLSLTVPPDTYNPKDSTIIDRYLDYWLPSVNISWNFTDKILARVAYGKTLNRPNYRELIPLFVNDPRLEQLQVGNDSLKDAEIHNFDIRGEWYPAEGEFISVGVFYKRIINAIEPYIFSTFVSERLQFANTPRATVFGVEAEVRKSLNFIPWRGARRFSVIANFAVLESEIEFEGAIVPDTEGNFQDNRTRKRPLEGTASYVVNGGLYYEHEEWGTKISALYNVTGQRLVYAGTSFFPETYELPRHVIDLTLRQRINKHLEFRAGVQDLLNQSRRLYRDYDRNQRWDPDLRNKLPRKDWMFQEYKPGSYYMAGFNLTF